MIDQIKTLSGHKMSINSSLFRHQFNTSVRVISELSESFVLEDRNQYRSEIQKETLLANNIAVNEENIILTEGLYDKFFKKEVLMDSGIKNKEAGRSIFRNFRKLIAKKDLVISNPYYYSLKPDFLSSAIYSGPKKLSLGTLFELWDSGDKLDITKDLILVNIRGGLSSSSLLVWSKKEEKFKVIRNHQQDKFRLFLALSSYADLNKTVFDKEYIIADDLLRRL